MEEMYGLTTYREQIPPSEAAGENRRQASDDHQSPETRRRIPSVFGSNSKLFQTTNSNHNNKKNNRFAHEDEEDDFSSKNRAKIMSHPLYPKLLHSYIACQKVGAPPEIENLFNEIFRENDFSRSRSGASSCIGDDPELDEFMETYCEMLDRYRSDLAKPFNEATVFLNNMQTQLTDLCNGASVTNHTDEPEERSDKDLSMEEAVEVPKSDWTTEDRALKEKLLRKYSKYISSLKHEFSNKKKKGKLPKEARQVLLDWWNIHYRWPYPTEADKIGLAESTGLDQKQINNWFINQRKRHWKPSENMQFSVMDSLCGSSSSFLVNN